MGFSRQECWSGVPLPSLESLHIPQEKTQVVGNEKNKTHLRSQTRIEIHPYNPPHLYAQFPIGCLRMESDVSASITDLSVADCAEGLQVVQGALPSSTRHGLDVVHLPEMPFPWVSYQLIKL